MTTLNDLLSQRGITLPEVHQHLDRLTPEARVREATSLDRPTQAVLWGLAVQSSPVTHEDLVPASKGTFDPEPFQGQNDQPLFRSFKKVFYRLPDGTIAGRNESSVAPVVGHGYYSVVPGGPDGVYIDYTRLPQQKPASWPEIRRNDRGVSIVVYGFMKDYLRRVHGRILIGHAQKPLVGSMGHFVLARPD